MIPHFIAEKYQQNMFSGKFQAATMFLDISGFTSMTERLMKEGKEGAEVLSNIINNVFDPVIDIIYKSGGFISNFAGDAFTSIFPDTENANVVVACALRITDLFQKIGTQDTKFGTFELFIKLGFSYGEVEWGIIGSQDIKTYYFRGDAIDSCSYCEHQCQRMDIVLDDKILTLIDKNRIETKKLDNKFYKLINVDKLNHSQIKTSLETYSIHKKIIEKFIPGKIVALNQQGEFREIVSVFISFEESTDNNELNHLIGEIISNAIQQGGYFNKMDFGDKGGITLVIFGAPTSYEDNQIRALNFVYQIWNSLGNKARIGITTGIAYCGIVGSKYRCEYTALGDIVNQSARFMMKADWGDVWLSGDVYKKINKLYEFEDLGKIQFTGKQESIQVYKLQKKSSDTESSFFTGKMVGRQKEMEFLKEYSIPLQQNKFAGIVTVYGEAGMGKSRLTHEFTSSINNVQILLMQTDSILKISMNPFKYFMHSFFDQLAEKNKEKKMKNFETVYNKLLNDLENLKDERVRDIISELKRTKSIISAQIEVFYEHSLYEELDPKGRYENTVFAYKELFKALSLIKPIVIQIEDIQWIDQDSQHIFQIMCRLIEDYPIMILATSRLNDDGSKPKIDTDKEILQKEIVLERLEENSAKNFIELHLKGKAHEDLLELIKSKTEYNPFYIEQFINYLHENNFLYLESNLYRLNRNNIEIPSTLNAIIIARIDRLESRLKDILQIASVLGREVELQVLLSLLSTYQYSQDEKQIAENLKQIEKEQIWTKLSEIKYMFRYALLHEAIYEMQLKGRIRELHNLAAQSIVSIYKDNPEKYYEIANHYDMAEIWEEAGAYYLKAGEYYKNNYENVKAIDCFNRYLILVKEIVADKMCILNVLKNKASILELIGKWDESQESYERCIRLSDELGCKEFTGEMKCTLGELFVSKGQYTEAIELFEQTKDIAIKNDFKKLYTEALRNIGSVYWNKSEREKSLKNYEECRDICLKINDKDGYSKVMRKIGNIYSMQGDYDTGMKFWEEAKNIQLELGNKLEYSAILCNIGAVLSYTGDYENALKYLEESITICLKLGDKKGYSLALSNIGNAYSYQGDYDKAIHYLEEGKKITLELGYKFGYSIAMENLGDIYIFQAEYDRARQCFEECKRIGLEIDDRVGYFIAVGGIGLINKEEGNYEKALQLYNEAIEIGRETHIKFDLCELLFLKADLLYILKDYENAKLLNDEAYQMSKEIQRKIYVFSCEILKHKLHAIINPQEASISLMKMLKTENSEENIAIIHYEIFKINKDNNHKIRALHLYRKLIKRTPKREYSIRIDELNHL